MRILAPAKLNLFLHLTGRRTDGYHDLETVFQLVDLYDEVDLVARRDGAVRREPAPSSAVLRALDEEQDLTVRAARLLQVESGSKQGVNLHVHKRIPAGGSVSLDVRADASGTYTYYSNMTSDPRHGSMKGELVVKSK